MKRSGVSINDEAHQKVQPILEDESLSWWKKYAYFATGEDSVGYLALYELLMLLLSGIPGAAGFFLRQTCYPFLFGRTGSRVMIGRHVTLRGARRIKIGNHVFIDDFCVLDARGSNASIVIGDHVVVSRNTIIRTKGGGIAIEEKSDIGSNCILSTDSQLKVGKEVLMGAFSYLCGGGSHNFDDPDVPILRQGFTRKGGIGVGDGAWIGTHAVVLDGADIGTGAIVGAQSLVNGSLPDRCIAHGVPAKVQRFR